MSISRVVNNISAINANRNLDKTGRALQKSIERLSSGLRINRASDDAAGMVVANNLRTQVQGLNQAVTNASDGINLVNVAEGALEETTVRLNRIRQLAIQAANTAVNDLKARRAIQDEIFQSIDEVTRIANTTQFASNYLLNGDFSIQSYMIAGQEDIGVRVDASPVASTLASGKSFLNIIKVRDGSNQIIAGDAKGSPQVLNTGLMNQKDVAVTMAHFGDNPLFNTGAIAGGDNLAGSFFNGVSVAAGDTMIFTGVLADGVTRYTGAFSIGAGETINALVTAIQDAINNAEKALFGVNDVADVPEAYHTTVAFGADANLGRLVFESQGNYINRSSIDLSLVRGDFIVTQAKGVTRSGAIGVDSILTGGGQVGNSITAITGSTFGVGQFDIVVQDVQVAQQRLVESTIAFRDANGSVINRTVSIDSTGSTRSLVVNGSFVGGIYTGGTTLLDGDTITLRGTNADGTTFEGTYTLDSTADDTVLNDFTFASISGLIQELNYRTRDYGGAGPVADGVQTRFEDALFTFTSSGVLQLVDDIGRSNSQTSFTLTFQRDPTDTTRPNFTLQDKAVLTREGFAESATFSINGGEEVRAEAGDVITLFGKKSTIEGVPQPQMTFRVGSGFSIGIDKLEATPSLFKGTLNGGPSVEFMNGDQDVVFVDGTSGGDKGVARFVTIDFDNIVDVTARKDGLPDTGRTIIISTVNSSLNFHVGAQAYQAFRASIGDLSAENLGFGRGSGMTISDIDVTTTEGANLAIKIVDEALNQVNKTRSILGAVTNRLEATISNLSVSSENLTASESRIRDTDIARESSEFTKNQVLIQAGISVLAQANFQSQGFLSFLG
ncbi:MAG TPA: flagellin [bacterium]|nr:flagellin [bacterium]